ncbi:unnamed protein product [Rhizoctonia solani]|uniref:Uncharacterized protein n=1 Tax=Rhizoctonia solani TaxID=456999 RepID=A0A8H2XGE2_9AGAM|nr:unnamed protein product [Rhizoctonia solani]
MPHARRLPLGANILHLDALAVRPRQPGIGAQPRHLVDALPHGDLEETLIAHAHCHAVAAGAGVHIGAVDHTLLPGAEVAADRFLAVALGLARRLHILARHGARPGLGAGPGHAPGLALVHTPARLRGQRALAEAERGLALRKSSKIMLSTDVSSLKQLHARLISYSNIQNYPFIA